MKVKVFIRNVNAETEFQDDEEAFERLSKKQKQKTNPPKRKGLVCKEVEITGTAVEELKHFVLRELYDYSICEEEGFTLEKEHVRVFKKKEEDGSKKPQQLACVHETDQLCNSTTYFALEVFDVLPTRMLRTVRLDELYPATLCLPNLDRSFTKVSPFKNAAMSQADRALPWHGLSGEKELHVHGISVFCKNTAIAATKHKWNPFVEVKEKKDATYSIPLGTYDQLIEEHNASRASDGVFGIMETTLSHNAEMGQFVPKSHKIKADDISNRKKNGEATEQHIFLRFSLQKGTDLKKHGMAVVYDNLGDSEGHCTLVCEQAPPSDHEIQRLWVSTRTCPDVFLSEPIQSIDSVADADLVRMLSPLPKTWQPEILYDKAIRSYVLPCLAAEFQLHDFVVKARAEPLPLDSFDDDDAQSMYNAVTILFSVTRGGEDDVFKAIEMLEAKDYMVGYVDSSTREVLLQAMEKVDERDLSEMDFDAVGLGVKPIAALENGIDILGSVWGQDGLEEALMD